MDNKQPELYTCIRHRVYVSMISNSRLDGVLASEGLKRSDSRLRLQRRTRDLIRIIPA